MTAAIVAAALGSALVGGVFYAFSAFVMRGLDALPPRTGLAAMQQINREAPKMALMIPLMGTLVLCLVLIVATLVALPSGITSRQVLVLAGGALYLLSFAATAAYHVPHNDALAVIDPSGRLAGEGWRDYAAPWVLWNHVRSAAALLGSGCLSVSLLR